MVEAVFIGSKEEEKKARDLPSLKAYKGRKLVVLDSLGLCLELGHQCLIIGNLIRGFYL